MKFLIIPHQVLFTGVLCSSQKRFQFHIFPHLIDDSLIRDLECICDPASANESERISVIDDRKHICCAKRMVESKY